jgi:hypothetical protein
VKCEKREENESIIRRVWVEAVAGMENLNRSSSVFIVFH